MNIGHKDSLNCNPAEHPVHHSPSFFKTHNQLRYEI